MSTWESGHASVEPISVKIPEAVRLTGLSRSRIYELMGTGEIEFAKIGSSTLILVRSLRQLIEGHCQKRGRPALSRPFPRE